MSCGKCKKQNKKYENMPTQLTHTMWKMHSMLLMTGPQFRFVHILEILFHFVCLWWTDVSIVELMYFNGIFVEMSLKLAVTRNVETQMNLYSVVSVKQFSNSLIIQIDTWNSKQHNYDFSVLFLNYFIFKQIKRKILFNFI